MEPFAKKIIKDIDDSTVIGPDLIENDIFGKFNSTELSAGVKTLLLIYNQPKRSSIFQIAEITAQSICLKWLKTRILRYHCII